MQKKSFALALMFVFCLCLCVTACGSATGTYYLVQWGEYDMQTYFTLKGGKWTDEDGEKGEYKIDGDKITFYADLFGEKMELMNGTIEGGVLTVENGFGKMIYAKEGAWSGENDTPNLGIYTKRNGKIYFGKYPQTQVKDSTLTASLDQIAGSVSARPSESAWSDVDYQNERYRKVYVSQSRLWFKYEPIEWRILRQEDGTALLMANIILDSRQYCSSPTSDYAKSDIRKWLTGTFYETAFNASEQTIIEATEADHGLDLNDAVFLLSLEDICNSSYGFCPVSSFYDAARRLKCTDYAKSQGAYVSDFSYSGNGWWWLRSPSYNSNYVYGVCYDGFADSYSRQVVDPGGGVVPALCIRL